MWRIRCIVRSALKTALFMNFRMWHFREGFIFKASEPEGGCPYCGKEYHMEKESWMIEEMKLVQNIEKVFWRFANCWTKRKGLCYNKLYILGQ